jgi:hypothetical protein
LNLAIALIAYYLGFALLVPLLKHAVTWMDLIAFSIVAA